MYCSIVYIPNIACTTVNKQKNDDIFLFKYLFAIGIILLCGM